MKKLKLNEPIERKPKNYRTISPECCFTCEHSKVNEIVRCEFNYGNRTWGGGDRTGVLKKGDLIKVHYGIDGLGLCDEYKRKL